MPRVNSLPTASDLWRERLAVSVRFDRREDWCRIPGRKLVSVGVGDGAAAFAGSPVATDDRPTCQRIMPKTSGDLPVNSVPGTGPRPRKRR
jgi:hypothetical protein